MEDVVTIPNTAVKMNESRKKRAKNGMIKIKKRREKRKSDGRRMNQPKKVWRASKSSEYAESKALISLSETNSLTLELSE